MNVLRRIPLLISLLLAAGSSYAAGVNIGVVAPQDGNFASLGAEITAGANFEVQALKDSATVVNEPCTEDGGRAVARR
jgi:branched-chain amino acid transport system substrate-binding protein